MKKIILLLYLILIVISCTKSESHKINEESNEGVKYIGRNSGVKLKPERQKLAFGKWKLTNLIFENNKGIHEKIPINEDVTITENGVYNSGNKKIAKKYRTVGTYEFLNLDTLNTVFMIREIDSAKSLRMITETQHKFINKKRTDETANLSLYFAK